MAAVFLKLSRETIWFDFMKFPLVVPDRFEIISNFLLIDSRGETCSWNLVASSLPMSFLWSKCKSFFGMGFLILGFLFLLLYYFCSSYWCLVKICFTESSESLLSVWSTYPSSSSSDSNEPTFYFCFFYSIYFIFTDSF
jgi:hypothetical protein